MGLRLVKQWEIKDFCAHIFTETCLPNHIPDQAVALGGQTMFRADRCGEADSVLVSLMLGVHTVFT